MLITNAISVIPLAFFHFIKFLLCFLFLNYIFIVEHLAIKIETFYVTFFT